jgi:hypothetical protein
VDSGIASRCPRAQCGFCTVRRRLGATTKDDADCLLDQLDEGELGRVVNGHEEIELAFGRLHLGSVQVEVTDRVALELLLILPGLSPSTSSVGRFDVGAGGDATRIASGARLLVEAHRTVIERQQLSLAEGHDDRLFMKRERR